MKKWVLFLSGTVIIICAIVAILWWKNRLPETTLKTSYGLTVSVPSGFQKYDHSVAGFLDDPGQTFVRCSTPNTSTISACADELAITVGLIDSTPLNEAALAKIQQATGVTMPMGTISFDLLWLLSEGTNDITSKEETVFTVAGLPATGVLITNPSLNMVEYYIHIVRPTKPVGIYVSGRGSEAQNVKAVTDTLLQSMTLSDL